MIYPTQLLKISYTEYVKELINFFSIDRNWLKAASGRGHMKGT